MRVGTSCSAGVATCHAAMLSGWKRLRFNVSLQLSVILICIPKVTCAQMAGGMAATNYRYVLPLYLSGDSWSTILHLHNAAKEESGVSLLVRGADGISRKRLHLTLAPDADQDIVVGSLLLDKPNAGIQAGSVIVVQESSMGPLVITGSAELRSGALTPMSIAEPLSLIDIAGEQNAVVYREGVEASTLTAISSVGSTAQELVIDCQPGAGKRGEPVTLPAHGTLLLRGCALEAKADLQPPLENVPHASVLHVKGVEGTYVVFAFDLSSRKVVIPQSKTPEGR